MTEPKPQPHPLIAMLAAYRRSVGISQLYVAQQMGTGQSAISDLETGGVVPSLNTLERYVDALGVRVVWGIAGIESAAWPNVKT